MSKPAVTVSPWRSGPTHKDPSAERHDCLWDIAKEQATIHYMKHHNVGWDKASGKITNKELMHQLDDICKKNGFRKLYGGGSGRDPNLIFDGEKIKVTYDPTTISKGPPGGAQSRPMQSAYRHATGMNRHGHVQDMKRKEHVDKWLDGVRGFDKLPEGTRAKLLEAQGREGMNRQGLSGLAGHQLFTSLSEQDQHRLIDLYGAKDRGYTTNEIDKLVAGAGDEAAKRKLGMIVTPGFSKLNAGQQQKMLERYGQDKHFRAAIDHVITRPNFIRQGDTAQAHALDIMRRYSLRKGEGYGERFEERRTEILVKLYDLTLSKPDFKLQESGSGGKPETDAQAAKIDSYVSIARTIGAPTNNSNVHD